MKRTQTRSVVVIATTILAAAHPRADAVNKGEAPTASYTVQAQVVGSGGAPMTGANGLSLDGTIGEVSSPTISPTNGLTFAGGFWKIEAQIGDNIFASAFDTIAP